jgi:OmpA-OmpF porin, OOP family
MRQSIATTSILIATLVAGGCATKKYVRNTAAPIQAKVDQVGEQAQKQGQDIEQTKGQLKQVDENAQTGINAAKERAMTAENRANDAMSKATDAGSKADQAGQKADQAGQKAEQANTGLAQLRTEVSNLDDYKLKGEATIPFRFNKYSLDASAKEELDKLASQVGGDKRFFIAVEGFTDTTGQRAYNEELSRHRADAVAEYLVAKHDIPIYRIHMIGLGKEKPVDMGKGRAARAKNRRVEVKIYTAGQTTTVSQTSQPPTQ